MSRLSGMTTHLSFCEGFRGMLQADRILGERRSSATLSRYPEPDNGKEFQTGRS